LQTIIIDEIFNRTRDLTQKKKRGAQYGAIPRTAGREL